MRRTLAVIALLLNPLIAWSAPRLSEGLEVWSETQILTRAAPSTSSTDGKDLTHALKYRLSVCAASGQTLTGGTIQWDVQDATGLWATNYDLTLTITGGTRCQAWPGY